MISIRSIFKIHLSLTIGSFIPPSTAQRVLTACLLVVVQIYASPSWLVPRCPITLFEFWQRFDEKGEDLCMIISWFIFARPIDFGPIFGKLGMFLKWDLGHKNICGLQYIALIASYLAIYSADSLPKLSSSLTLFYSFPLLWPSWARVFP